MSGAAANAHKPAGGETNALNLRWSFGFNSASANTVHSLSSSSRHALFYAAGHTGVIHDLTHDSQLLLQGHCNPISHVCVSKDKRWIATADYGADAMIVVWDALKATPVKIIPSADQGGVAAMDMSSDAMFLVTLSYDFPQTLSVWEWPSNATTPAIAAPLGPSRDYQHCVRFNPVDVRDIVSNGTRDVIFWSWNENSIAAFHPPKGVSKLKKAVRTLTQTTFIPYTTKAVTATSSGHIVAWDYPVSELAHPTQGRDAIKILKLVKSGILLLDTIQDKFLVCGCSDGAVRFFDFQFRVVAWFEDIKSGHITSISFADQPVSALGAAVGGGAGGASTGAQAGQVTMEEFAVPDFIVGTSDGKVLQLDSKTMEHLTADKRRGKLLVQGFDEAVYALDAHPALPVFAVGTLKGSLQIWDVDERKMVACRKFEIGEASASYVPPAGSHPEKGDKKSGLLSGSKRTDASAALASATAAAASKSSSHKDELINDSHQIQCVRFGPKGHLLAIGFSNGFLKVLAASEAATTNADASGGSFAAGSGSSPLSSVPPLKDVCAFHRSEGGITSIVFSPDGHWIATSDMEGCIAVYRFWHKDDDVDKPVEWIYVGKYKSHYRPVVDLFFEAPAPLTPAQMQAQAEEARRVQMEQQKQKEEESKEAHSPTRSAPSSSHGTRASSSTRNSHLSALAAATHSAVTPHSTVSALLRPVPRLFSLGEDRVLQEYDLANSSIRAGLKISSSTRLEQTACPTAMMSLPGKPMGTGKNAPRTPDLIITANDEYKLKVWEMHAPPTAGGAASPSNAGAGAAAGLGARSPFGFTSPTHKSPFKSPFTSPTHSSPGSKSKLVGGGGSKLANGAGGANSDVEDPTVGMSPSELEEFLRPTKLRKTLLAPMYGGAINKLFHLPKRETASTSSHSPAHAGASLSGQAASSSSSSSRSGIVPSEYLVYSTFDKIVGLMKLPLDGNPTKSMALLAHPGEVSGVVSTFDGKYILTAGGADRSVHLWAVSTPALDAAITLGGQGIEPYLSLVEGGREGPFFQELLDYFTYAQLRAQGLSTTNPRKISGYITVDEAVNLMRALGFYPTEQQVVAIKAEVRHENKMMAQQKAAAGGQTTGAAAEPTRDQLDLLNLDEFLKLYLNHRPVFGLGPKAFEDAFKALSMVGQKEDSSSPSSLTLSSEQLVQQLLTLGDEPMSVQELSQCLDALLGEQYVPADAQDVDGRSDLSAGLKAILSRLPAHIDPQRFAQDILGFEDENGGAGAGGEQQAEYATDPAEANLYEGEGQLEEESKQPAHSIVISHAQ